MTTKQRFRGVFRLELRERDHLPAHVHLVGAGFDVVIDLVSLRSVGHWPTGLQTEVVAWVAAHRYELMTEWKKWHP